MTEQTGAAHPDRAVDAHGLRMLVGWTHATLPNGIDLRIQCAASSAALESQQVEIQHVLMTRNQALLLAKYLLDTTGQSLPPRRKPTLLDRLRPRQS